MACPPQIDREKLVIYLQHQIQIHRDRRIRLAEESLARQEDDMIAGELYERMQRAAGAWEMASRMLEQVERGAWSP